MGKCLMPSQKSRGRFHGLVGAGNGNTGPAPLAYPILVGQKNSRGEQTVAHRLTVAGQWTKAGIHLNA